MAVPGTSELDHFHLPDPPGSGSGDPSFPRTGSLGITSRGIGARDPRPLILSCFGGSVTASFFATREHEVREDCDQVTARRLAAGQGPRRAARERGVRISGTTAGLR